jgi:hypothetical protein
MEIAEEPRVLKKSPRAPREVDAHRWTTRALEHEVCAISAHDLGRRVAVLAHVAHDRKLIRWDTPSAVTTQDGMSVERIHVRVATACERF